MCPLCGENPCCCPADEYDADELGIDPDAKWGPYDSGVYLPGMLPELPKLPDERKP